MLKKNNNNKDLKYLLPIIFFLISIPPKIYANLDEEVSNCEYQGNYVFPPRDHQGSATSIEIGLNLPIVDEQLGKISMLLINKDWPDFNEEDQSLICERLIISDGIFRGKVNSVIEPFPGIILPLIDHVITNGILESSIYTRDDYLDPNTITLIDDCTTSAVEVINVVRGTNRFGDGSLEGVNGTLFVSAELNICTGHNSFQFLRKHNGHLSRVCFGNEYCQ